MAKPAAETPRTGTWQDLPEGSSFNLLVRRDAHAPYIVADNTLIVTPPPNSAEARLGKLSGSVEIIAMRTSFSPTSQMAVMGPLINGAQSVGLSGFVMEPFDEEIGRLRLDVESAVNLATAILKHVIDENGIDLDLVKSRLVDRGVGDAQVSDDD